AAHVTLGLAFQSRRREVQRGQRRKLAREGDADSAGLLGEDGNVAEARAAQDEAFDPVHQVERRTQHGEVVAQSHYLGRERKCRVQLDEDARFAAHVVVRLYLAAYRRAAWHELAVSGL